MAKKTIIGGEFVLVPQALSLMFLVMWVMMNGVFIYFNSSFNAFAVASIGLLLLVGLNILMLKFWAISMENNVIIARNLFYKKTIKMNKFQGVKTVFFSPIFFSVEVENTTGYYFMAGFEKIFSITKTETEIALEFEKKVRSNI